MSGCGPGEKRAGGQERLLFLAKGQTGPLSVSQGLTSGEKSFWVEPGLSGLGRTTVRGAEGLAVAHGSAASGTRNDRRVRRARSLGGRGGCGRGRWGGWAEQTAGLGQAGPLTGGEEAVIADFLEAFGQDVLQEAADEFLGRQGAG
jgi:hypothetical protein